MLDLGTLQAHIKLDGADKFKSDLDDSGRKSDSLGSKLKNGLGRAVKAAGAAVAAAGAAMAAAFGKIAKDAVDAYAQTEQLTGGVQKLFGDDAAQTVIDNANRAFQTVGISANEYMENVTSFSASLISSMGGDTQAAAQVADMAMQDMADNANVFGSDMASIQNAYQGFAKQNYTMLDNLKLGYGGTKTEMERLLKDAQELSGVEYNIDNLNDVYQAIHVIQEEQNIAGTTAKEAATTIEGSINSTKAAWENLMAGLADSDADVGQLVDNLIDSAMNVVDNITPVIERIVDSIGQAIPKIANKIQSALPQLLPAVTSLVRGIASALPTLFPALITAVVQLIPEVLNALVAVLPDLIDGIIDALLEGIPLLLDAALEFLMAIVDALPQIIDKLVDAIPKLVDTVVDFLVKNYPKMAETAFKLFMAVVEAVPKIVGALGSAVGSLLSGAAQIISNFAGQMASAAGDMIQGLINGLLAAKDRVVETIKGIAQGAMDTFKSWLGIASPSKVFTQYGDFIMQGLGNGLQAGEKGILSQIGGLADSMTKQFNPQLQASYAVSGVGSFNGAANGINAAQQLGNNYNVYINGTRINDDAKIQASFMKLMNEMARKGMM